jgi:hypothetical protein
VACGETWPTYERRGEKGQRSPRRAGFVMVEFPRNASAEQVLATVLGALHGDAE